MLNKLLNWFRRPKWEEFRDDDLPEPTIDWDLDVREGDRWLVITPVKAPDPQWRTNFSLTAAQRSERSRKAAATRKANKAKSNGE